MVKSMVLRELHTLEETTMDKVRFLMSDTGAQITAACREALEQKGVDVTVVEKDGNKVLQKMLAVRPQVVLLDAFMPGLDALAVKQRYNAAGERHTSFFVTGAFQSEEMVQELLDEGFSYYFVKPFDETVLAARVLKAALGTENRILHTSVDSDELTVTEILHQIGVPAHIKGYQFLRDAILLTMSRSTSTPSPSACTRRSPRKTAPPPAGWSAPSATPSRWHGTGVMWTPSTATSAIPSITCGVNPPTASSSR